MCGEQLPRSSQWLAMKGSPPRVRGTVYLRCAANDPIGITPACAGNSVISQEEVHMNEGSPPRVRGTDIYSYYVPKSQGITPACAGNRYSMPIW